MPHSSFDPSAFYTPLQRQTPLDFSPVLDREKLDFEKQNTLYSQNLANRKLAQQAAESEAKISQDKAKEQGRNERQGKLIEWYKESKDKDIDQKTKEERIKATTDFLSHVGSGKVREAEAMVPLLKNLGIDFHSEDSPEGPTYRIKLPEQLKDTFEDNGEMSLPSLKLQKPELLEPTRQLDTQNPYSPEEGKPVTEVPEEETGTQQVQQTQPQQDQYSVNLPALNRLSSNQVNPLFAGMMSATPERFQPQSEELLRSVSGLGLPSEKAAELGSKLYSAVSPMWRAEIAADAQMAAAGRGQQSQARLAEEMTLKELNGTAASFKLPEKVEKMNVARQAKSFLTDTNPTNDAAAIVAIARMQEKGVLTEGDYARASQGVISALQQIKNNVTQFLENGINPDTRAGLVQWMTDLDKYNGQEIESARDHLYEISSQNPEKFGTVDRFVRARIPTQYWRKQKANQQNRSVPSGSPDDLTIKTAPLPKTLDGSPNPGSSEQDQANQLLEE